MSDIYMSSAYHILCANFPVFLRQGACLLAVYLLFACPITVIWILFSGFEEIGSNLFAERQLFGSYFPDLLDKCPFCLLGYSFLVPASWFRREYVHFTWFLLVFWILLSGFAGRMSISLASYWLFGSCSLVSQGKCPFLWLGYSFLVPASWFRRKNVHFPGFLLVFWFLLPDFARNMSISLASYWLLTGFLDPAFWFRR